MANEKTDLYSSIKVLLSLFIMLEQDFDALVYYQDHIEEASLDRSKINLPEKHETIDYAIIESLWFQIIIKSCSFLDEWDKFLGVQNEPDHIPRLRLIKKVVSPARKAIGSWKDLKKFRNEITAHNFRDKEHTVTIENISEYDCPQTTADMFYLIGFLARMVSVLTHCFPEYLTKVKALAHAGHFGSGHQIDHKLEFLKDKLKDVDELISENTFEIARFDIFNSIDRQMNEKK